MIRPSADSDERVVPGDVTGMLGMAVERHSSPTAGRSGARLDRVRLADSRALVVKQVDAGRDWIMRATGRHGKGRCPVVVGCPRPGAGRHRPAVDYGWYLAVNGASIDATHDELLDDVRRTGGASHDEDAPRIALLGSLAQLGWEKALGATEAGEEAARHRERDGLAWWAARAREGLEVWARG